MEKYRLTTVDNPFNPFTQWDEWYFYDLTQGYNTCERIARNVAVSEFLPQEAIDSEYEQAFDQLIFTGAISNKGKLVEYKKVLNPNWSEQQEDQLEI